MFWALLDLGSSSSATCLINWLCAVAFMFYWNTLVVPLAYPSHSRLLKKSANSITQNIFGIELTWQLYLHFHSLRNFWEFYIFTVHEKRNQLQVSMNSKNSDALNNGHLNIETTKSIGYKSVCYTSGITMLFKITWKTYKKSSNQVQV